MRCQVCGKIIAGNPIVRKTCCVNKLYVFCSTNCLKAWSRGWLKREGTSVTSRRGIGQRRGVMV
ncbi:MAG: TRASH domain-containing protein [Candidatus Geothermarchaeales archaeon]